MAWWEWNATGQADHPHVIVCVHGLTRQGRDFDVLARALCTRARVVCPDIVGRGQSDWLADPMGYQVPLYVADMQRLLTQLACPTLDWVGTSMGGMIGMGVAGSPGMPPVRRLVLNDIGPRIEAVALARIGDYVGMAPRFENEQSAIDYLRELSISFGPHTPEQWRALSLPMLRPDGSGVKLHYDPRIGQPMRSTTPDMVREGEAVLWSLYDQISARTLLLRGAQSDLLSPSTALEMTQRGPRAQLVEFPGVGHAPTLVAEDQVRTVSRFLLD